MQRLRSKFTRSRTPGPPEMTAQNSLEASKPTRSASFDETKMGAGSGATTGPRLTVPPQDSANGQSLSFDSTDSNEEHEGHRLWSRRRSSKSTPPPCVHCQLMKAWKAQQSEQSTSERVSSMEDDDFDDEDDDDSDNECPRFQMVTPPPQSFAIVQTSPPPLPGTPSFELQPPADEPALTVTHNHRRSIFRQEAMQVESAGSSLDNVTEAEGVEPRDDTVRDIYLMVPELKRNRAVSVDSSFTGLSGARSQELDDSRTQLTVPGPTHRSRSVDIVLPTANQSSYKAVSCAFTPPVTAPKQPSRFPPVIYTRRSAEGSTRVLRATPDWGDGAVNGDHLWSPTHVSGESCYLSDSECQKQGSRIKCAACKIVIHLGCLDQLLDRLQFKCKPTFRDVGVRQYREQTAIQHHWVHRKSEKGKCKTCGKSFRRGCCGCVRKQTSVDSHSIIEGDVANQSVQAKLSFNSKDIVALTCSWCKDSYHNKDTCFNSQRIGEHCNLGSQANIIVPPSWIVKLPSKGSFKSSLRKTPKKKSAAKKKGKESKSEHKTFVIKPIPTAHVSPVLVFINPKSGGNQGAKLLQKFQWLLNPRQVFDLTQGGPGPGLELFRKVPSLRILACGGDGTVGWVLSVLDKIGTKPAVGVLPLGTGNDLARALGWGGGYEDEPLSKILANIGESDTVLLDRWELTVEPNTAATGVDTSNAKQELPLNVVNNYFSFGVDAHIALEFHEAREAHPEKFNSRIRNKLFYGTAGGKDLMQRKWKGLAEFVTMECDGKDLTPVLREHRVHAIVFLNIPSYGGGTHPWNKSGSTAEPSTEDGLIEVVGLTTYQLPLLQAGAHGTSITQCKTAKIVTSKVIPMQVDGEACRLAPSVITISRLNQAIMLAKKKPGRVIAPQATMEKLVLTVNLLKMVDYEMNYYDKDLLASSAELVGTVEVNPTTDLEQLRAALEKLIKESQVYSGITDWWFVDSVTAERFFRIDKAQENLHYPADIGHDIIYILEESLISPETETPPVDTTATVSLGRTGPSISLETTTGQSVSLDISQSADTPSAGISIDVSESQASDGSPAHTSEQIRPKTPTCTPEMPVSSEAELFLMSLKITSSPYKQPVSPTKTPLSSPGDTLMQQELSPPLCVSPQPKDRLPSHDSITKFKTNLLEKTSNTLLKAAKVGDLKLMNELHAAGYSLLSIDATGQTALHIAARYGNKEIVKYLIAEAPTAILNMRDNERGQTALHKAAANKRRTICSMLVAGGASLSHQDHAGHTPRQLALRAEDHKLATYLESQEHFQLVSEDLETAV